MRFGGGPMTVKTSLWGRLNGSRGRPYVPLWAGRSLPIVCLRCWVGWWCGSGPGDGGGVGLSDGDWAEG
jgi:hypothetical protein